MLRTLSGLFHAWMFSLNFSVNPLGKQWEMAVESSKERVLERNVWRERQKGNKHYKVEMKSASAWKKRWDGENGSKEAKVRDGEGNRERRGAEGSMVKGFGSGDESEWGIYFSGVKVRWETAERTERIDGAEELVRMGRLKDGWSVWG